MHEMNEGAREAFVDGFDDPAVLASWRAMNDLVDRLTPGEVVSVSNYADERLVATFMSLAKRGELAVARVRGGGGQAAERPLGCAAAVAGRRQGVLLPARSGGYWVSGKRAICEASEALKPVVVGLGDARQATRNCSACPV